MSVKFAYYEVPHDSDARGRASSMEGTREKQRGIRVARELL